MNPAPKSVIQPPQGPNRRIYRIPSAMLLEMLQGKRVLPVPEDVSLRSFWPDHRVDADYLRETDCVLCVSLEHPSFEAVSFKVPEIDLVEKKPVARVEVALVKKASA